MSVSFLRRILGDIVEVVVGEADGVTKSAIFFGCNFLLSGNNGIGFLLAPCAFFRHKRLLYSVTDEVFANSHFDAQYNTPSRISSDFLYPKQIVSQYSATVNI